MIPKVSPKGRHPRGRKPYVRGLRGVTPPKPPSLRDRIREALSGRPMDQRELAQATGANLASISAALTFLILESREVRRDQASRYWLV